MSYHRLRVMMLVVGVAMTAGCKKPNENARVHVNYRQVANFHEFKTSPDAFSSTSAGNGMFIMYRINQIANSSSEATVFTFDKHKIVMVTQDQTSNVEPGADNILLGNQLISTLPVQAGQVLTQPGGLGCVIKNALTANPQSLANAGALLDPLYQLNAEQPVSMHREAGNNSVAVVITALPSGLQNLCSGS